MSLPPLLSFYTGNVYHKRHKPFIHDFSYRVTTCFFDLDRIEEAAKSLKLFSYERFNLFGFTNKDHGPRDGSPLRPWVEAKLHEANFDPPAHIYLLSLPRVLGYLFAPLSVYYCYDQREKLYAVLYQVKNTFGGQRSYILPAGNARPIKNKAKKAFYVSPFIEMDCCYNFEITEPHEHFSIAIHQEHEKDKMLTATWNGSRIPLTDRALRECFLKIPFQSVKTIAAIYWQAFHLWRKGSKYIPE